MDFRNINKIPRIIKLKKGLPKELTLGRSPGPSKWLVAMMWLGKFS